MQLIQTLSCTFNKICIKYFIWVSIGSQWLTACFMIGHSHYFGWLHALWLITVINEFFFYDWYSQLKTTSLYIKLLLGLHVQKLTYALGPDQVHVKVSCENANNINIVHYTCYTDYFIGSLT